MPCLLIFQNLGSFRSKKAKTETENKAPEEMTGKPKIRFYQSMRNKEAKSAAAKPPATATKPAPTVPAPFNIATTRRMGARSVSTSALPANKPQNKMQQLYPPASVGKTHSMKTRADARLGGEEKDNEVDCRGLLLTLLFFAQHDHTGCQS